MTNPFEEYPPVMLSFSIILLIFFACIVGSINECDNSCSNTNRELNKTGLSFGIIGLLVSLTILLYSCFIIKNQY